MKREVYKPSPDPDPATDARQRRRTIKRTKTTPRSELPPEKLAEARRRGLKRQQEYRKRKRIAAGLPPIGKGGRPRKRAPDPSNIQPENPTTGKPKDNKKGVA